LHKICITPLLVVCRLHVPKIIKFYLYIQMLPAKCKWLHFSWATLYASCMTISGGRIKQLDIIAGFLPRHWLYEWLLSADICVMHDDLGWKNRTSRYNRFWRAGCSRL